MKNKFKFNLWRGLAFAVVALALAGSNGFALAQSTSANPATPAVSAVVPAAQPAVTEDIRDIRGPKPIPSPWTWPLLLAGGAALAALLYAAWRWNRRRTLAVALLPYEIALARLEKARPLMQPESAREFSIAVSEIVRQFIEARFHVRAERRTTEEFLHDLLEPSDALLTTHRELLADFLRHCDLAKFARWILSMEEMETMIRSAHNFVIETGRPATKKEAKSEPARLVPERANL